MSHLPDVVCGRCGRVRAFGTPFCDHGAGLAPPARWADSTHLVDVAQEHPEVLRRRTPRRRFVQVTTPIRAQRPLRPRVALSVVEQSVTVAVEDMSRDDVRDELRDAALKVGGTVDELRARLAAHRRTLRTKPHGR